MFIEGLMYIFAVAFIGSVSFKIIKGYWPWENMK